MPYATDTYVLTLLDISSAPHDGSPVLVIVWQYEVPPQNRAFTLAQWRDGVWYQVGTDLVVRPISWASGEQVAWVTA